MNTLRPASRSWLRAGLETLFLALLLVLALRLIIEDFHVDGQSMEPSLHDQELIIVNKAAYLFQPPARGEIIVFHYPRDPRINYIKRIIALPGDIVSIVGETVIVNGIKLKEPYINRDKGESPYPPLIKRIISPDSYFVLGDNRDNSSDSRYWGYVPREDIIGQALFVYWPMGVNNLGPLPDERRVFSRAE